MATPTALFFRSLLQDSQRKQTSASQQLLCHSVMSNGGCDILISPTIHSKRYYKSLGHYWYFFWNKKVSRANRFSFGSSFLGLSRWKLHASKNQPTLTFVSFLLFIFPKRTKQLKSDYPSYTQRQARSIYDKWSKDTTSHSFLPSFIHSFIPTIFLIRTKNTACVRLLPAPLGTIWWHWSYCWPRLLRLSW